MVYFYITRRRYTGTITKNNEEDEDHFSATPRRCSLLNIVISKSSQLINYIDSTLYRSTYTQSERCFSGHQNLKVTLFLNGSDSSLFLNLAGCSDEGQYVISSSRMYLIDLTTRWRWPNRVNSYQLEIPYFSGWVPRQIESKRHQPYKHCLNRTDVSCRPVAKGARWCLASSKGWQVISTRSPGS